MSRIAAFGLGVVVTAFFSFMIAVSAVETTRKDAERKGRIDAAYDMIFDGYMLYLGCLSDHCETERSNSEAAVEIGHNQLKKLGVAHDHRP